MAGSDTWRLGHRPALDGLRGVAIALVVIAHFSPSGTRAHWLGAVGVAMFFTLSGFLITSLLITEHQRTGRLNISRFYARRALRLLPALVTLVAVVSLVSLFVKGVTTPAAAVGTLTYLGNWVIVVGGDLSGFGHTWSLAVEEQFYVVWPALFLLLVRLPARRQVHVLAAVVAGAAMIPGFIGPFPWAEVYHRTDARAVSLLAGCLLAFLLHRRSERSSANQWAAAAALALVVGSACVSLVFTLVFAPLAVALGMVVLIAQGATTKGVAWLSWAPLRLLGRRSYGLYLWHSPVIALAARSLGGWQLVAVALPLSLALTELSWRLIEAPALRLRGRLRPSRLPGAEPPPAGRRIETRRPGESELVVARIATHG